MDKIDPQTAVKIVEQLGKDYPQILVAMSMRVSGSKCSNYDQRDYFNNQQR